MGNCKKGLNGTGLFSGEVYLTDSQYDALVETAAENGQDFSAFVRAHLIKCNLIPTE